MRACATVLKYRSTMQLLPLCVGVVVLAAVATASPLTKGAELVRRESPDARAVTDANAFVDAVLAALRDKAIELGLDPMQLPDELHGFSVEFLFITYHGELEFTQGWLENLSTIYRSGESEVDTNANVMEIKTLVKFDRLLMTYKYKAKIMDIGPKGDVIGHVDDMVLSVDLLLDLTTCVATLKDLQIKDAGRLDVRLDGSWFFDVIFNAMIDMFTFIFNDIILWIIEGKIREAVETTLPTLNFGACVPPRAHTRPLFPRPASA